MHQPHLPPGGTLGAEVDGLVSRDIMAEPKEERRGSEIMSSEGTCEGKRK